MKHYRGVVFLSAFFLILAAMKCGKYFCRPWYIAQSNNVTEKKTQHKKKNTASSIHFKLAVLSILYTFACFGASRKMLLLEGNKI